MLIRVKPSWELSENLVTPEDIYLNRRRFLKAAGFSLLSLAATQAPFPNAWAKTELQKLKFKKNDKYLVNDKDRPLTKEELAASYNNFYEFSLDKDEVRKKVEAWKLNSWKIEVSGTKNSNKTFDPDSLTALTSGLEERIYRFRCVEAWSMVVPWIGFPLADLIKKLEPNSKAKFIKFQTFNDHKIGTNMSRLPYYPWPYVEALTMEEARHPLTFIATGMYGKTLPKQNGAPLRLIVPWKYGFKSIKSIVKIEFVQERPQGLWEKLASDEYGFYANVNPKKDHPRWSQATERLLDGKFFPTKIPTLPFNGYEKEVAGLYKGLDLMKNY